jgi:hypothetical protein
LTQISAAENLIIDFNSQQWQLRNGENAPMLAVTAQGLHYNDYFAATRRLPANGFLMPSHVLQVIVGWQRADEAWHLGLVLAPELAQERGSRWCELAHWPDPETTVFEDLAQQAAHGLAAVFGAPYYVIPPRPAEPAPPPPPLPDLPLNTKLWQLRPVNPAQDTQYGFTPQAEQLVFQRQPIWQRQKYRQALWYLFWAVIYAWLSIATLTSDLALPNAGTLLPDPHILPYLGILIALGLVVYVLFLLWQVRRTPDTLLIDPTHKTISAWKGERQAWSLSAADLQSIYVTEILKKKAHDHPAEHGELNFHLGGGTFRHLLIQGDPSPHLLPKRPTLPAATQDTVMPLSRELVVSDLQGMGLYLAEALGVSCWYDLRVK